MRIDLVVGYVDPNTSQHIFSLLGPMLALLTATGGLAVAFLVCLRRRIASCFRNASRARRAAAVCVATSVLVLVAWAIWRILR